MGDIHVVLLSIEHRRRMHSSRTHQAGQSLATIMSYTTDQFMHDDDEEEDRVALPKGK